jgi:hypothetical protein
MFYSTWDKNKKFKSLYYYLYEYITISMVISMCYTTIFEYTTIGMVISMCILPSLKVYHNSNV